MKIDGRELNLGSFRIEDSVIDNELYIQEIHSNAIWIWIGLDNGNLKLLGRFLPSNEYSIKDLNKNSNATYQNTNHKNLSWASGTNWYKVM